MRYFIDDELVSEEVFFERLEEEVEAYVDENYDEIDEIIDDCYGEVKVGNLTFSASEIVKKFLSHIIAVFLMRLVIN